MSIYLKYLQVFILKLRDTQKEILWIFTQREKFLVLARGICFKLVHLLENVASLLPICLECLFFWFQGYGNIYCAEKYGFSWAHSTPFPFLHSLQLPCCQIQRNECQISPLNISISLFSYISFLFFFKENLTETGGKTIPSWSSRNNGAWLFIYECHF